MAKINLNEVAKAITIEEGGKHSVAIGDVKEIMKNLFDGYSLEAIVEMWQKYNRS